MGMRHKRVELGYTIIEVMLFFGVTGALMIGILGSATLGVNAQRYNDAVSTFTSIIQQEFTNTTNIVNTKSVDNVCGGPTDNELERGTTKCIIVGRLMTIDNEGNTVRTNLVAKSEPATTISASASELDVIRAYEPKIDPNSKEEAQMNWGTKIQKVSGNYVSILIVRSPRSGNVYSYVVHSSSQVIGSDSLLDAELNELATATDPINAKDQYMCVDRAGWVLTPVRAVKIAPFASGPSGVSSVETSGAMCD